MESIQKFIESPNRRLILLIVFYLMYLFMGALVFDSLESPNEARIIKELNQQVREFRRAHNACLTDDDLNSFIKMISSANDKGVPATGNVSKEQNWSFGQAVFFSGTVLTTIGYGDVFPQTQLGKVFCIIYALIGLPATLLLLYAIIDRLMSMTYVVLGVFTDKVQPMLNKITICGQQEIQRSHMHILFTMICSLIVLIFFFIIPASVYSHIEKWSYLDAFYYCFISLSTVGLGDYVPGDSNQQNNRHLYKIFSTIYLIIGVMVMVWLLQIFSETPEFNLYKYFTLIKDGLLTNHKDIIHTASEMEPPSIISDHTARYSEYSSSANYQQQYNNNNETNRDNDDELITSNSNNSINNQT